MASINVGAVEVTVTPNAQGFGAKLGSQVTPQAQALGDSLGRLIGDAIAKQVQDGINRGLGTTPSTRTQGQRQGDAYAGSFADAFRARITASMRSLPEIKLTANSSDAEIKLQGIRSQLETLSNQRIGIDIDEATAFTELELLQAKLEELHSNASTIQVKADTAAAKAELDLLIEEIRRVGAESPTVKVDADTAGAEAQLAALGAQASSAGGGFSTLIAIGLTLGPALIPVIAAVTAAAAGLVGVLGALAIGGGVLALGFHGIAAGVSALDKSQKAAGGSGRSLANTALAIAGAQRQVEAAERSLANARANADDAAVRSAEQVKKARKDLADAEQQAAITIGAASNGAMALAIHNAQLVADAEAQAAQNNASAQHTLAQAERDLAAAQQNALDAQTALTDARKTAAQQAEDLANQVIDGQNAQRQATLDVADAQSALDAAKASDPTGSSEAAQKAQLAYDVAVQRLDELVTQNQRLADQKAASDAAGIEGSEAVVSAQQNIVNANQAVLDQQYQLGQVTQQATAVQKAGLDSIAAVHKQIANAAKASEAAQVQATQNVAKAQKALNDALRQQATQQRQSAQSIAQAVDAVASAKDSLARSGAAGGGAAAITQQADAFQKLSPVAQQFARFVHDELIPAFSGIQDAAAKGLLPGVEAGLKILLPVLPGVAQFVGKVAKALGDLFENASKALTDPFWTNFFQFAGDSVIPILKGVAQFIGDVAGGFAGLIQAFAPVLGTIGGGMLDLADSFKKFGEQAGTPGSPFQTFLGYVEHYAPIVGQFFTDLSKAVGNIIQVFAPFGGVLLDVIDQVLQLINHLGPSGLAFAFTALGGVMAIFMSPISAVITGLSLVAAGTQYLYDHVQSVHDYIDQNLLPIFQGLSDYFTDTLWPVLKKIVEQALEGLKNGFEHVTKAIKEHKPELEDLVDFITTKVLPIFGPVLKTMFETAGTWIADFITVIAGISNAFELVTAVMQGKWDLVHQYFSRGLRDVVGVINEFIKAINSIPGIPDIPFIPTPSLYTASTTTPGDKTTSGKGSGLPGGQRGFAVGGVLPGYAPGVDSIVAMLSPGEGVLVPEAVRLLGPDWVYAMNAYASRGRGGGSSGHGHYSWGGIVDTIGSGVKTGIGAVTGVVSGVEHRAVDAAVSTAKHFANQRISNEFFRSVADSQLDRLGNALKFANGGVVGNPWGGLARSVGSYSSVDSSKALTAYSPTVQVTNNHRPMGPSDIVTGMQQHYTLYGRHLMAGTGIPGVG